MIISCLKWSDQLLEKLINLCCLVLLLPSALPMFAFYCFVSMLHLFVLPCYACTCACTCIIGSSVCIYCVYMYIWLVYFSILYLCLCLCLCHWLLRLHLLCLYLRLAYLLFYIISMSVLKPIFVLILSASLFEFSKFMPRFRLFALLFASVMLLLMPGLFVPLSIYAEPMLVPWLSTPSYYAYIWIVHFLLYICVCYTCTYAWVVRFSVCYMFF